MSLWLGGEFSGRNTAMDFEVDTDYMAYNNFNFTVTENDKKYYVDWGDGTPIEQLNTTTDQHNYSSNGIYRIRVWSQEPDNKIDVRYGRSSSTTTDGSWCIRHFTNHGLLNHAYNGGVLNTNIITPHFYFGRWMYSDYLAHDPLRLHAESSGNFRENGNGAGYERTTHKSDSWYLPKGMEFKQYFTIGDGKPVDLHFFRYRSNLGNIDYTKLDLSEAKTMYRSFFQPTYNSAAGGLGATWNNGRDAGVTYTWNADVSNVSTFRDLFFDCRTFNGDVSSWTVGSTCTDMTAMFYNCYLFDNGGNTQLGPAWDTSNVTSLDNTFYQNYEFNSDVTHWDTSSNTTLNLTFGRCFKFNNGRAAGVTYTWNWDTSNVTTLQLLFQNNSVFNGDIGGWNVGNVTNFRQVFQGANVFNHDLSSWAPPILTGSNVYRMFWQAYDFNNGYGPGVANSGFGSTFGNALSGLTSLEQMFNFCYDFNSDVSNFAVGPTATSLNSMFSSCLTFNNGGNTQGLSTWDTRSVTDFYRTFYDNRVFNCDLTGWDTGSATSLSEMFNACRDFNNGRDPGVSHTMNWDTSSCTNMYTMFGTCLDFNGDVSGFDTSSCTNCSLMFNSASVFNQNIGNWDLSSCTTMYRMLRLASSFNQDLGGWSLNTSTAPNMTDLLVSTSMSTENFSRTLIGWANYCYANSGNPGSVTFSGTNLTYDDTTYGTGTYTDAVSAYGYLTGTLGWTITGATDVS